VDRARVERVRKRREQVKEGDRIMINGSYIYVTHSTLL
jgi:hypothetical protein